MLKKREWIYVQPPMAYEVFCDICNNPHVEWSEFEGMVWCWRCLKDTRGTGGVFDGPIPVNASKLLGICLDRIDLATGQWLVLTVKDDGKIVYGPLGNVFPATDVFKLYEALKEYQRFNRLGNDLDAYLYAYGEWALGESEERPNYKDYGVNP